MHTILTSQLTFSIMRSVSWRFERRMRDERTTLSGRTELLSTVTMREVNPGHTGTHIYKKKTLFHNLTFYLLSKNSLSNRLMELTESIFSR